MKVNYLIELSDGFDLFNINWCVPMTVFGDAGAYYIVEHFSEAGGDGSHYTSANGPVVDLGDGCYLRSGTCKEYLIAYISLGAVYWAFNYGQAEFLARQFHSRSTGDAFEDILCGWGCD